MPNIFYRTCETFTVDFAQIYDSLHEVNRLCGTDAPLGQVLGKLPQGYRNLNSKLIFIGIAYRLLRMPMETSKLRCQIFEISNLQNVSNILNNIINNLEFKRSLIIPIIFICVSHISHLYNP
jgi:hypothetical protein